MAFFTITVLKTSNLILNLIHNNFVIINFTILNKDTHDAAETSLLQESKLERGATDQNVWLFLRSR
jgi:hypothetical protein